MRHENHIKIEMMKKQKKRAEEQQHHHRHFMMDDVELWVYVLVQSVRSNNTTAFAN